MGGARWREQRGRTADEDRHGPIGRVDLFLDGVVVELVGRAWHLDRFSAHYRRYARLTGAGYRFLPFTFDDVEGRSDHVVAMIAATLARAAS